MSAEAEIADEAEVAKAHRLNEQLKLMRGPAHPGWREANAFRSALDAMGHRKAIEDRLFDFGDPVKTSPDQIELWLACKRRFKRNLKGRLMSVSQYGLEYVDFRYGYPIEVVKALGTAPARELLQKQMISELEKLAETHPVAVWRRWPEISADAKGIACLMRLHVMTEDQYQYFVQEA